MTIYRDPHMNDIPENMRKLWARVDGERALIEDLGNEGAEPSTYLWPLTIRREKVGKDWSGGVYVLTVDTAEECTLEVRLYEGGTLEVVGTRDDDTIVIGVDDDKLCMYSFIQENTIRETITVSVEMEPPEEED